MINEWYHKIQMGMDVKYRGYCVHHDKKGFVHHLKNFHEAKVPEGESVYPCIVQEKHDGVNCIVIIFRGEVGFFTRTGNKMTNVEDLEMFVKAKYVGSVEDVVFFTELCHDDHSLEELSGLIKHNRKKVIPEGAMDDAYLVAFDTIKGSEFRQGFSFTEYMSRWRAVNYAVEMCGFPAIVPVDVMADNELEAQLLFDMVKRNKGEGIVRKQLDIGWSANMKNYTQTKEVVGVDFDLEVVDLEEGKGKRKGTMAKVVVRWRKYGKPDGELTTLNIDGCFSDEERVFYWKHQDEIIGKVVHVHGLCVGSKGSIRIAKVKVVRIDKNVADL